MSRARKAKRAAEKPATTAALTVRDSSTLEVIDRRLLRACDLLTCLEFCQNAELNLGSLAIAVRDLLDTVRADLVRLRRQVARP